MVSTPSLPPISSINKEWIGSYFGVLILSSVVGLRGFEGKPAGFGGLVHTKTKENKMVTVELAMTQASLAAMKCELGTSQSWKQLNELNLAHNKLSGEITAEIGSLSVMNYLDLSENRISGSIPGELQNLKLNRFNFSYNQLSSDFPPLHANKMYKNSLLGNPSLCGEIAGLCPSKDQDKQRGYVWLLRLIFALVCVVFIVGVTWLLLNKTISLKKD